MGKQTGFSVFLTSKKWGNLFLMLKLRWYNNLTTQHPANVSAVALLRYRFGEQCPPEFLGGADRWAKPVCVKASAGDARVR